MGQFYDEIPDDPKLFEWIQKQPMFHVASAPLNGGSVNVSPKGLTSFKLVSRKACWYIDLVGSGNETISHMYEPGNGRLTIMFEAFEGDPQIVRFYGKGRVIEKGTPEFTKLLDWNNSAADELDFPTPELIPGTRSIIWMDIEKVGTSCGYSVPLMQFQAHRKVHTDLSIKLEGADSRVEDPFTLGPDKGVESYKVAWNTWSIDGLPGMKSFAPRATKESIVKMMNEHGLRPTLGPYAPRLSSPADRLYAALLVFGGVVIGAGLSAWIQNGAHVLLAR